MRESIDFCGVNNGVDLSNTPNDATAVNISMPTNVSDFVPTSESLQDDDSGVVLLPCVQNAHAMQTRGKSRISKHNCFLLQLLYLLILKLNHLHILLNLSFLFGNK